MSKINPESLNNIFAKLAARLDLEIQYFKEDGSKCLDPEEFCTLHKTVEIIGDLVLSAKNLIEKFEASLDLILAKLMDLMKDDSIQIDTSFSDIVLNIMKIHMSLVRSKHS